MADGLPLLIEPEIDERAATATLARAQRIYEEGARDISRSIRDQLTDGTRDAGRAFDDLADRARRAYSDMGDAAARTAREERNLSDARESGASNIDSVARRAERARLDEAQAIRQATDAYSEYERAARQAGDAGDGAGRGFVGGLRGAVSAAGGAGEELAGGMFDGFAGSSALLRIGAAGGPVGLALGGLGALGVAAGKVLADNIEQGLQSLQMQDLFQGRLGASDGQMATYGRAAAGAYANAWGETVQDNLSAIQFGVQGGLIDRNATDADIQATTQQMQALSAAMNSDVQDIARSSGQLIRGGLANSAEQAMDILAAGSQRGLDISGDWLDTVGEYTTQFRKLGLDGGDAIGLIQQGLEGAARDSDVVADSLKEFSIRAVDGSKDTAEGFAALGFNADDMRRRFAEGGDTARSAFGAVLQALRDTDDPMQQKLIWAKLFGTQFEDMGDAINKLDLGKARQEVGNTDGTVQGLTDTLGRNTSGWDTLGRNIDVTFDKLKRWLADSDIGRFISQGLPGAINTTFFPPDYPKPDDTGVTPRVTAPGGGDPRNANPLPADASSPTNLLLPGGQGFTPAPAPSGNPLTDIFGLKPPPPAGAPGAPDPNAPKQGDRTPIVADADQQSGAKAKPSFDPSQYSLDAIPVGQFPGLASAPGMPAQPSFGAPAPQGQPVYDPAKGAYGQYEVDPQRVYDAETSVLSAKSAAEQARVRVLELEASGNATQQELNAARTSAQMAERSWLSAQSKLADAQQGTWKKLENQANKATDSLGQVGAKLDDDLGVSKGLAGIADNITRFVANLAFAPLFGELTAQREAAGFGPGEAGGGLIGMLASTGAFGDKFVPVPRWARDGSGAPTGAPAAQVGATTSSYGQGAPGAAMPGEDARTFAHRVMMPFWESKGLEVGDHAADQYGEHQNGALDIMVGSIAEGNAVLQQVLSDPNVKGAIFNNQTYGYGHGMTPRDYSAGHTGDPNQDHTNHVHALYKPGDPGNINPGGAPVAGVAPTSASLVSSSSSGATPVFVVNMPGGAMVGTTGDAPAGAPGAPPPGGPPPANLNWDALAAKESSGNWAINTGNGYYGGLQFDQSTWDASKPAGAPSRADLATRDQQIAAATAAIAQRGGDASTLWPQNYQQLYTPGGGAPNSTATAGGPGWFPPGAGLPATAPGGGYGITGGPGQAGGPGFTGAPLSPAAGGPMPATPGGLGAAAGVGLGMPGIGSAAGAAPSQSVAGGRQFGQGLPASSGISFSGGIIGAAASMAGQAASFGAGGGAASDMAMQLIGRAIGAGGQYAGNAVGGLMETFMLNDSALGDPGKSWLGRLAIAGAGMRPALPNSAGALGGEQNKAMAEGGKPQPPGPLSPQQASDGQAANKPGQGDGKQGDTYNIDVKNERATEDGTGRDIQASLSASSAARQPR